MRRFLARLLGRGEPGALLLPRVRLRRFGTTRLLEGRIDVAALRWGDVVRALAALVADVAAGQQVLGQVTVVAGEPPVLMAIRTRPDLVATRFLDAHTAGVAHRRPTLWLAMNGGIALGRLVDPDKPFEPTVEQVAPLVSAGECSHALLTEVTAAATGVTLRFQLYASSPLLLEALRSGRRCLATIPGWESAR